MRLLIAFIIYALCLSDYHICEHYYKNDNLNWWVLRTKLYSLEFLLFGWTLLLKERYRLEKVLFASLIVFLLGDFFDRAFFNDNKFQENDIALVIMNVIVTLYSIYKTFFTDESKRHKIKSNN